MQVKKILILLLLLTVRLATQAQAPIPCFTLGQTPGTSFPVCGSSVFLQNNVPSCGGTYIPVPGCTDPVYSDINPFWYKFTCFQTGTLGFLIKPINPDDDYDWQIFDITNRDPQEIYSNDSLFVAGNWSGRTGNMVGGNMGVTGAVDTGTLNINCQGFATSNINAMPTLYKGHEYILLVSNFSNTQVGYQLSFGGGTSVITDTVASKIVGIKVNCTGDIIGVKLSKRMLCSSLANDGSDFTITTSPAISFVEGAGCSSGFDMDSVTIHLANPLPVGNYQLMLKNGGDGNTILDLCSNGIPSGDVLAFQIVPTQPTLLDSVAPVPCSPSQIALVFPTGIQCSSIDPGGTDFSITGPSTVTISSATTICNVDDFTNLIYLNLSQPINVDGLYTINLKTGVDLTTIINECSVPTPPGSATQFTVLNKVNPAFNYQTFIGCKSDTIRADYMGYGIGRNNTNSWQWYVDDSLVGINSSQALIFNSFINRNIKIVVSNGLCTDSLTQQFIPIDHSIKAGYIFPDTICPTTKAKFVDTSKGVIVNWEWDFGNGNVEYRQFPSLQSYPSSATFQTYQTRLVVTNQVGCVDTTAYFPIVIKDNAPTKVLGLDTIACAATTLLVKLAAPVRCASIAQDGSNFSIIGQAKIGVVAARGNCNNGLTTDITLYLASPIKQNGSYRLLLQLSTTNDSIVNECGIRTLDTAIAFSISKNVFAKMDTSIGIGCSADTLRVKHDGKNNVKDWTWTLSNGSIAYTQNASFVYSDFTPKVLQLIVTNNICADTAMIAIIPANHEVEAGFIGSDSICSNSGAAFKDTSKGIIKTREWSFGNGNTSTQQIPPVQNYPGANVLQVFPVQLVVTNQLGCVDSVTKPLFIRSNAASLPDTVFVADCAPTSLQVHFTKPIICSTIDPGGSNFSITDPAGRPVGVLSASALCNNGVSSFLNIALASPLKTNGVYRIGIHSSKTGVQILGECNTPTPNSSIGFTIKHNVQARIDTITKIGCLQDTLVVKHDGNNNANDWYWELDTIGIRMLQKDTFIYNNFQPKKLFLMVSNGICLDTNQITILSPNHTVQAAISTTNDTICPNTKVPFINNSLGNLISYQWNFGNGVKSGLALPPPQAYPALDSVKKYFIQLIVKNTLGCYDTSQPLTLVVKSVKAVLMDSVKSLSCAPQQLQLRFKDRLQCGSIASDGSNFSITGPSTVNIANAVFNCNDGLTSEVLITLYSPIWISGTYQIHLKKSSSGGNLLSECGTPSPLTNVLTFKALSAVDATFSSNIKYGCKTDTIIYTHNGFNDVNIWRWHLDDGITSTNKDTTVVYSDLNTKKVALYVSNGICSDSTATIIPLKNKGDTVNAGFALSKQNQSGETTVDLICPEEAVLFRNNSRGVIQSWLWTFGDNQTSTAQNPPAKRYKPVKNATTYAIKLLVKGNYCTDTASQYLTVIPNCYIAVPTAFSPNDDGLNDYLYPLNAYKADDLIFKVYNRFGQLVFETNNWQVQWNGKVKGKPQSAGTYAWILQYTDRDSGKRIDEKGTTVLIR